MTVSPSNESNNDSSIAQIRWQFPIEIHNDSIIYGVVTILKLPQIYISISESYIMKFDKLKARKRTHSQHFRYDRHNTYVIVKLDEFNSDEMHLQLDGTRIFF